MTMPKWFSPNITLGSIGAAATSVVVVGIAFGNLTGNVDAAVEENKRLRAEVSELQDDLADTKLDMATLIQSVAQIRDWNLSTNDKLDNIAERIAEIREAVAAIQVRVVPTLIPNNDPF